MKKSIPLYFFLIMLLLLLLVYIKNDNFFSFKRVNVAFLVSTQYNPFFVSLVEGAEEEAEKLKINLKIYNSKNDIEEEIENMKKILENRPDVILINPINSTTAHIAINMANEYNIPIITVDRSSDSGEVKSHIASDNLAGSRIAASYIYEKLNGEGKVVEILGVQNTNVTADRQKGFETFLKDTNIKIVAKKFGNFEKTDAFVIMKHIIQTVPKFDAIYCHNDSMALGVLDALGSESEKLLVIGFDGTEDAINAVKSGKLAATIAQRPKLIGKTAVETALAIVKEEAVDKFIPIPLKIIERD